MAPPMLADYLNLIVFCRWSILTDRHLCIFAQLVAAQSGLIRIYITVVRYAYHYSERGQESEFIVTTSTEKAYNDSLVPKNSGILASRLYFKFS